VPSRSSIKFEGGYTIETVFDGNKAGVEPYSVQTTPTGELLILDSANSNLYRVSTPISRCKFLLLIFLKRKIESFFLGGGLCME